MKRIAKALFSYSEDERRANMVGINLFFGALLGANLGVTEKLNLGQYAMLVVALASVVMAMFTIAASRRPVVIWGTAVSLCIIIISLLGQGDRYWPKEVETDIYRTLVTLLIWLGAIMTVKMTPAAQEEPDAPAPGTRPLLSDQ